MDFENLEIVEETVDLTSEFDCEKLGIDVDSDEMTNGLGEDK